MEDEKPNPVYEQIRDDDNYQAQHEHHQQHQQEYTESSHEQQLVNQEETIPKQHQYTENQQTYLQASDFERNVNQGEVIKSSNIDQHELGKYANFQEDLEDGQNIKITISKTLKKGGIVGAYIVYFIQGYDSKGAFNVARRFNEFFQMRVAMVNRWPGCFVPSIPAKNALGKTDQDIVKKRIRYLNQFVKKIAKLPHLYYGEEFQSLLRATQSDISELFSKWPALSSDSIINKYRVNFAQLAGKQLNFETSEKIKQFHAFIKKSQPQLAKDRESMKLLAQSNDKLINSYGQLFTNIFPAYEKTCLLEYCFKNEGDMLYSNESQIKLQQHSVIIKQGLKSNEYWVFYDMIRHQERDGLAFLQALQGKTKYEHKKHAIQVKINSNEKHITELQMGKKPFSIGSKGTSEQIKYKLQVDTEQLKRQKQNVLIIIDIITALIAYIEIERYKQQKRLFYSKALRKLGITQINQIQNLAEVWTGLRQASLNKLK